MSKITLMMVTFNRLNLTKKTFETTMNNTGCNYNLVVVDNGSTDDTVKLLKDEIFNNKYIDKSVIVSLNKNMGIAYGRNLCLLKNKELIGETDYLCTIDNDVILPNNWLKRCCSVLTNNYIVACGVNLEGVNYPKTSIKCDDVDIEIQIKPKGNLGTACAVFKYNIHNQIGYFDNLEIYGHEDALAFFRIRQASSNKALAYLKEPGEHLGVNKEDSGEYREMKNKHWDINMKIFNKKIREYANKQIPIYNEFSNYNKDIEIDVWEK